MIPVFFKALAGQSASRVAAKAVLSVIFVAIAAYFSRGDVALAIIIIFTGVTGPAIRLVTMKMNGTYDRIVVSPGLKSTFFLRFAGVWFIAVILPLVPSIAVVAVIYGSAVIVQAVSGTILAVSLGSIAGIAARGLSEAHLTALFAATVLIFLSFIKTPMTFFMPYTAFSSVLGSWSLVNSFILPVIAVIVLALVAFRL